MLPTNNQLANEYAIFRGLQASTLFADANIVLGRNYLASQVQQDAPWLVPSVSGRQGVGIIVQVPTLRVPKPNSLQREREFSIGIYEEPNVNFTAGVGTFTDAVDWADRVIDFLWNWRPLGGSGLVPDERAAEPDTRFSEQGIIGVRCVFVARQERRPPPRCALPAIAVDGNRNVTITVTDGSQIWFTTDGFTYPAPSTDGTLPSEQKAQLYQGPFAAFAGAVITAVAWPASVNPPAAPPLALPSLSAVLTIN